MILHLMGDSLYIDRIIRQFETVNPDKNIYLLNPSKNIKQKYPNDHLIIRPKSFVEYYNIVRYNSYDFIIVHGFDNCKMKVILKIPEYVKIVWVMWGGDFYSLYDLNKNLIGTKTQKLLLKSMSFSKRCKEQIKWLQTQNRILYNIIKNISSVFFDIPSAKNHIKSLYRVDYFATNIIEDFILLSSVLPVKGKVIPFLYKNIDYTSSFDDNRKIGNNILIGNSNGETNNHIEIFELISNFSIESSKIIVPLSYGTNMEYRSNICLIGNELFGNKFSPLLDILPQYEYEKIIETCTIAIMNHNRQQGIANIIYLLLSGCKVFFNKNITTYTYLKRLGFIIYSIQDDLIPSNKDALSQLSIEDMNKNKSLILREFGEEKVYEYTLNLISAVNESEE